MIDKELLEILACPASYQALAEASEELVARLESRRRAGELRTVTGAAVEEPVTAALVRADGTVAYPIRDGIPVLLVDEGITVGD